VDPSVINKAIKVAVRRAALTTFTRLAADGMHPSSEGCRTAPVALRYSYVNESLFTAPATAS
jgi:hypothetical protein